MATGDPFYCFEHKCDSQTCFLYKHGYETEENFKERIEQKQHPECPYCKCSLSYPLQRWVQYY